MTTQNTIRCIVKGDKFQAAKAAAERGIPFAYDHGSSTCNGRETYGDVGTQHEAKIMSWFCEDGTAPFPVGALLYYTGMRKNKHTRSPS